MSINKNMQKNLDRTMEAEDVTLLRNLIDMSLRNLIKESQIELVMLVGVDGRIFAQVIPNTLTPSQYSLFNHVKINLHHICHQLKHKNMKISFEQFPDGVLIISGVGDNAFLACIVSKEMQQKDLQMNIASITKWSIIVNHVFKLKPLKGKELDVYDSEIRDELRKLSRKLFVEHFADTSKYKKNEKILAFLKKKVSEVVGIGMTDELITLTFNELGTTAPYMNDKLWLMFAEKLINEHIKQSSGDIVADECYKTWIPELQQKLKTFI